MCSQGVACNKELWAEMENQFQSLEDQVEVVMVVEGDGTAHSLEKTIALSGKKEATNCLKER